MLLLVSLEKTLGRLFLAGVGLGLRFLLWVGEVLPLGLNFELHALLDVGLRLGILWEALELVVLHGVDLGLLDLPEICLGLLALFWVALRFLYPPGVGMWLMLLSGEDLEPFVFLGVTEGLLSPYGVSLRLKIVLHENWRLLTPPLDDSRLFVLLGIDSGEAP